MLHPVGKLPAAVYWRRRALVLLLLLSVLGGGGWLAVFGVQRWRASAAATVPAAASAPLPTPALEQVVPSLAGVQLPSSAGSSTAGGAAAAALTTAAAPCTDDMIALTVKTPATVAAAGKQQLQLVVTNIAHVPCVRDLARGQQEIVLVSAAGTRLWSSDDCQPGTPVDNRTLAAGQAWTSSVTWDGLTSDPTCAGPRVTPAKGRYVLRGRLGTKVSPDAPLTLT